MLRSTSFSSTLAALALGVALTGCASSQDAADPTAGDTTSPSPASPSQTPAESPSAATSSSPAPTQPSGSAGTGEPEEAIATLAVKIAGDQVTPNAESIELKKGEPLLITFDSDRAGELHVHAKPEQYVDFEAGVSRQRIVITTPGVVEIEDHATSDVLAVVEVR